MKKFKILIAVLSIFYISACNSTVTMNVKNNYREAFMESIKFNKFSAIKKGKDYVFTINGYDNHPSNQLLKIVCDTYIETLEGYCDVGGFTAKEDGSLDINVKKNLPKGEYKVKFFLKETGSWKVIWKKEPVEFEIF